MNPTLIKTQYSVGQLQDRLQHLYPGCVVEVESGRVCTKQRWPWLVALIVAVLSAGVLLVVAYCALSIANPSPKPLPGWVGTSLIIAFGLVALVAFIILARCKPFSYIDGPKLSKQGKEIWLSYRTSDGSHMDDAIGYEQLKQALAPRR